jgi:hypothetical protein
MSIRIFHLPIAPRKGRLVERIKKCFMQAIRIIGHIAERNNDLGMSFGKSLIEPF